MNMKIKGEGPLSCYLFLDDFCELDGDFIKSIFIFLCDIFALKVPLKLISISGDFRKTGTKYQTTNKIQFSGCQNPEGKN